MKVKHVTTTLGILLGGLVVAGAVFTNSAFAAINFEGHSDVQFTFNPTINLTLDPASTASDCVDPNYISPTFCIESLAPGDRRLSNTITAKVSTNSSTGYSLYGTVGGTALDGTTTFSTTDLELAGGAPANNFKMVSSSTTTLAGGQWGVTVNGSDSTPIYGNLPLEGDASATPAVLNRTDNVEGRAGIGCTIGSCAGDPATLSHPGTPVQIGAYASATQSAGAYKNVINFLALANVQTRTVTLVANNADVASVAINSVDGSAITPVTTGSWGDGQVLGITATCGTGKTFYGWGISGDFGRIANQDAATTTYTVGANNVIITAYCGGGM